MNKTIIASYTILLLFLISFASAYQVDDSYVITTLSESFNYTFPTTSIDFDYIAWYSDKINLNYTNISIVPYSSTGNATIYEFGTGANDKNFTVCGTGVNVNMSFQNLTSSADVYIKEDNTWHKNIGTDNITFIATAACKEINIEVSAITITITDPINDTIVIADGIYDTVNVAFSEVPNNVSYSLNDGSSISITPALTYTTILPTVPDGSNKIVFTAFDSEGNSNSTTRFWTRQNPGNPDLDEDDEEEPPVNGGGGSNDDDDDDTYTAPSAKHYWFDVSHELNYVVYINKTKQYNFVLENTGNQNMWLKSEITCLHGSDCLSQNWFLDNGKILAKEVYLLPTEKASITLYSLYPNLDCVDTVQSFTITTSLQYISDPPSDTVLQKITTINHEVKKGAFVNEIIDSIIDAITPDEADKELIEDDKKNDGWLMYVVYVMVTVIVVISISVLSIAVLGAKKIGFLKAGNIANITKNIAKIKLPKFNLKNIFKKKQVTI